MRTLLVFVQAGPKCVTQFEPHYNHSAHYKGPASKPLPPMFPLSCAGCLKLDVRGYPNTHKSSHGKAFDKIPRTHSCWSVFNWSTISNREMGITRHFFSYLNHSLDWTIAKAALNIFILPMAQITMKGDLLVFRQLKALSCDIRLE